MPPEVEAYKPPMDMDELVGDTTLAMLNSIFQDVMKRQEEKIDPIRSKFGKIEKEKVSMADKALEVKEFISKHRVFSFRQMLINNNSKESVIVTFLVMLELIKTGIVQVSQDSTCSDISITVVGNPENMTDISDE